MSPTLRNRLARLEDRRQVGWVDVRREVHLYYRKVPIPDRPEPDDGELTLVEVVPFTMRCPPDRTGRR